MHQNHPKSDEIVGYITNYLKYIKEIQRDTNPTSEAYSKDAAVVRYWENLKKLFEDGWPSEEGMPLADGFWPCTNQGTGYKPPGTSTVQQPNQEDHEAQEELAARSRIYVGPARLREARSFVPTIDIKEGMPHYHEILIQWWRPVHRSSVASDAQRYPGCIENQCEWERDPLLPEEGDWQDANVCIFAWKSRAIGLKIKLPKKEREIALDAIAKVLASQNSEVA
ncbi:hypothetical protein R1sor_000973 [Riccia sorocarpa]|uniref:Uncharacterized protein n=1 Tax=Riccia sorocarpa TaxID=122646 RepID=A0ABD3GWM0_9MARC